MYTVAVTRFSDQTWLENVQFRQKHKFTGCVYNSPVVMAQTVACDATVYVLEMNNSKRKIVGVGRVMNRIRPHRIKVYKDPFYNQFAYTGKYRVDRNDMTEDELRIITVLEELIFYGSGHLQRGKGIQCIPAAIIECKGLLHALGENLVRRHVILAAKERLEIGGVDISWIKKNQDLDLIRWLNYLFDTRNFVL